MATDPLPLAICKYCTSEQIKVCIRCKSNFCPIHSAKFSPNFCKDCLVNITSVWEKFTRTTSEYDPINDVINIVPSGSIRLQVDGADWLFYSAWIDELNDDEFYMVYQFHYFVLKLMEHDNEIRKIKKAHKLANAPSPMGVVTTRETRVKRTAEPKDMQKELEKLGLKPDMVKSMLFAAGIAYRESNNGQP